ncbi:MAG TPA: indole-3-glycerol-phosphate synthase [Polyangiales bacterium]
MVDHLARIVDRKRGEVARRIRRAGTFVRLAAESPLPSPGAIDALRRPAGQKPRVIAEIKLRSPSAGEIRARQVGEVTRIATGYRRGGAAAISVLADGPGFGGCPLDVRRAVQASGARVLFKEFVLDAVQVDCARALGASYVLLLVRVLSDRELARLIHEVRARGLEPVVEAADGDELTRALATEATIIGVNARDLRSFDVDAGRAGELVDRIPPSRVAVFMSGVRSPEDFARVTATRADAVLIGEGLMRAPDPGERLAELLR